MKTITCNKAYYIKLGRNGIWEESSLKETSMRGQVLYLAGSTLLRNLFIAEQYKDDFLQIATQYLIIQ